jgi:hypothetical protein
LKSPATRRRQRHPSIEGLEDRLLLYAANGGRWQNPALITYSFAPDGTSIGGVPSTLNQAMAARGISTASWQAAFQKAAAFWESVANVNLVQVPDGGQAFGTAGDQQGDPRFGDIRIGGAPDKSGNLASAFLPPAYNGGTVAGDIVFNTNAAWQVNNDYDVLTVAIHEIGHALGMDHSSITAADMYAYYNGVKQALTSDDIAGIQSIYGPRPQDSNNTTSTATVVGLNSQAQATLTGLSIASNSDVDWYKVVVPAVTSGTLQVRMQSSGISSLSPRVLVYNGSLQGLVSASSSAYGATVTATIGGVSAGQVYYIKCMPAVGGPTGAGAYGLEVNTGSGTMAPIAPPSVVVAQQPNQGGGSSSDSTGSSGSGGGLLGLVGGLVGDVLDLLTITIGTLSGYGEHLEAAPGWHAHTQPGHANPPHAHHGASPHHGHQAPPAHGRNPGHHSPATHARDRVLATWHHGA